MAQLTGGSDWINAYLEWTEIDTGISGRSFSITRVEALDDGAEETAAMYLEWMDEAPAAARREAVLLMALRAEAECMHMLRQVLDDGQPTSRTLRLAMEALDCAKDLLDDERRAWQALSALRLDELPGKRIAWDDESGMDWPGALESVEADMRALSGRILELRVH